MGGGRWDRKEGLFRARLRLAFPRSGFGIVLPSAFGVLFEKNHPLLWEVL